MHRLSTSFVLGYHGCDQTVAERLLAGQPFNSSNNDYDWLGPGIYFWQSNPLRGQHFADEVSRRKAQSIKTPAVVGAVIDMGLCLDLTTLASIRMVQNAYDSLQKAHEQTGEILPKNSSNQLLRPLDCAVIRRLHSILAEADIHIDTVRGVFTEGEPIYPNSGFYEKTHVQIAVCNPACIKGVFRISPDTDL